jgi:hypothetical protein
MKRTILGSLFGLAIAATTTAHAAPPRSELEMLARAFDEGALRVNDSVPAAVAKWTGTLYYAPLNGSAQPSVERQVIKALREMAAIAGLNLVVVEPDDKRVNVVARLSENEGPSGSQTCYSQWWRTDDGTITRVELYVNFKAWRGIDRCIVHESLHGFGFQSHAHSADSVLSYVSGRANLTQVDRLLLETLYDRRLAAGTEPVVASRTACRILAEKINATPPDVRAVCDARVGPQPKSASTMPRWWQR